MHIYIYIFSKNTSNKACNKNNCNLKLKFQILGATPNFKFTIDKNFCWRRIVDIMNNYDVSYSLFLR